MKTVCSIIVCIEKLLILLTKLLSMYIMYLWHILLEAVTVIDSHSSFQGLNLEAFTTFTIWASISLSLCM